MNENERANETGGMQEMRTQCGNPCPSSGEWNHSCTSELAESYGLAA